VQVLRLITKAFAYIPPRAEIALLMRPGGGLIGATPDVREGANRGKHDAKLYGAGDGSES